MKRKLFLALKENNQVFDYTDSVGVKNRTAEDLIEMVVAKGDQATNMVINKIKAAPKETWAKLKELFAKTN
jgi:hypothetical protein